jgi:hypothetical protein
MAPTSADSQLLPTSRAARSPRSAGIAGLLFAILFAVSVTILYLSVGRAGTDTGEWLPGKISWVRFAVGLMPFAGMFFLWFVGVVRARLGRFEDQFFATVFLGSGLIFLAMVFVAMSLAGAILVGYARDPAGFAASPTYYFARDAIGQIFGVYALRMAGVFLISQATLWLRTKVMPRWLVFVTYPVSLLLLFGFSQSFWVILVFPAWVFLVSTYVLVASFYFESHAAADGASPQASGPADAPPEVDAEDKSRPQSSA